MALIVGLAQSFFITAVIFFGADRRTITKIVFMTVKIMELIVGLVESSFLWW